MVFPQEIMYKVKISNFDEVESDIAENQHSSYTVLAQPLGALAGCMCKASAPCQNFHIFTFLVMTKATLIILERFLKLKNWTETRCYEISLQYNVPQNGDLPALRHSNS
jgi:hypothetical protein